MDTFSETQGHKQVSVGQITWPYGVILTHRGFDQVAVQQGCALQEMPVSMNEGDVLTNSQAVALCSVEEEMTSSIEPSSVGSREQTNKKSANSA